VFPDDETGEKGMEEGNTGQGMSGAHVARKGGEARMQEMQRSGQSRGGNR
jgi:hypothetical protein